MRTGDLGPSLLGIVAAFVVVLTGATVWIFLTDPTTVATAMSDGSLSPVVENLLKVLVEALRGLLNYL
jgi:hypothetical protein